MATINIWKGTKRVVRGNTYKTVAYVEFDGECLGVCWEEYDSRGVETTFFFSFFRWAYNRPSGEVESVGGRRNARRCFRFPIY